MGRVHPLGPYLNREQRVPALFVHRTRLGPGFAKLGKCLHRLADVVGGYLTSPAEVQAYVLGKTKSEIVIVFNNVYSKRAGCGADVQHLAHRDWTATRSGNACVYV